MRPIRFVALVQVTLFVPACRSAQPAQSPAAPTQTDRLMAAYGDLKGGRFAIIADFEDPKQMELVQLTSVSHRASSTRDERAGRRETGAACLRFAAASPDDAVVIGNQYARNWLLKRDWREYDLLLLHVYAPRAGLSLIQRLSGGPARDRRVTSASHPLREGWNLLRFDLFEVAERIPLDDVQEIRLSIGGVTSPTEVLFDDLVLAQSREDLLGDSPTRDKGLYVQRVGRRWKVGAKSADADFEITFLNGQIAEWYNLDNDPYRLRNLVRGTVLGPTPVSIGPKEGANAPVSVRSRIVEMNPVRVVVASEWIGSATPGSTEGASERIVCRWAYSIYPTGQLYVAVDDRPPPDQHSPESRNLRVALAADAEEDWQPSIHGLPTGTLATDESPYVVVRGLKHGVCLLYAAVNPGRPIIPPQMIREMGSSTWKLTDPTFEAVDYQPDPNGRRWLTHLWLGSTANPTCAAAEARAKAYLKPPSLKVELGSAVSAKSLGGTADGFDPAEGCFVVEPEKGRVRLQIGDRETPLFAPCVRIADASTAEAWVYANHLIVKTVARSHHGHLVFQLPGVVSKPTLVEVHFRQP